MQSRAARLCSSRLLGSGQGRRRRLGSKASEKRHSFFYPQSPPTIVGVDVCGKVLQPLTGIETGTCEKYVGKREVEGGVCKVILPPVQKLEFCLVCGLF